MIVFDLKCAKDHVFEAWFPDSEGYERQRKARAIACPMCGATSVAKAPMAPNVATRKGRDEAPAESQAVVTPDPREATARAYMNVVRQHIRENFDNVGDKFADEARRIHYGEADKRNIHGRATKDEAKALEDEGIDFGTVPFPLNLDS